jgi:hypothetical protein
MEPATPSIEKPLNFIKPAIAGGLFWGGLTAIPLINLGNSLCCMWIQVGGAIGAWLLNRQKPGKLSYGDGALVGVMTGICGTAVSALIDIPVQMAITPAGAEQMKKAFTEVMKGWPDAPPDFQEQVSFLFTPGFNMSRFLVVVITFSIVGGLFAMIGGILTVALSKRHRRQGSV